MYFVFLAKITENNWGDRDLKTRLVQYLGQRIQSKLRRLGLTNQIVDNSISVNVQSEC